MTYIIPTCSSGQVLLSVEKIVVPGTGTLNPDKIDIYKWTLPSGWTANGTTSTGKDDEIDGGHTITATYPASSTGGTIKVKGYQAIVGCDATTQSSKYATATINRDVSLKLTANKSSFRCGDTSPITYTLTATPALPCALYYWNNSATSTTSNTFQKIPGQTNETVTVTVIYGNKSETKTIMIPLKSFEGDPYSISGSKSICSTTVPEEYVIQGLPDGYTVNWYCSSNLFKVSENNSTAKFRKISNGAGKIQAKIFTPCGEEWSPKDFDTWSGAPLMPTSIIGFEPGKEFVTASLYNFEAGLVAGQYNFINSYVWEVQGGTITLGQGTPYIRVLTNMVRPNQTLPLSVKLTVGVDGGCGTSYMIRNGTIIFGSGHIDPDFAIVLSPNPATNETTLQIVSNSEDNSIDESVDWDYEVYTQSQTLKDRKAKLKGKSTRIDTSGWKEGIYVVRVKYKNEVLQEKLVVTK